MAGGGKQAVQPTLNFFNFIALGNEKNYFHES
jgi:hypothetical protein